MRTKKKKKRKRVRINKTVSLMRKIKKREIKKRKMMREITLMKV
jgi:hypothetical protein